MDKKEFQTLYKKAGYKNKKALADAFNLPYSSVNNWYSSAIVPKWVEPVLILAIKAKKYDDLINTNDNNITDIETLKKENQALKEKLKEYETLKSILKKSLE